MSRYRADQATCMVREREGRLLVTWRSPSPAIWREVAGSFRAVFWRHGDASYCPPLHTWSVPIRHRLRLDLWLWRTFAPAAIIWEDEADADREERAPSAATAS